ncbi:MAG: DNA gyrase subunit B, partial [Pseudomonadales bacterium]|nr:DNA gyrase subunit B [Pseudomonadales bacterium]
GKILNVEKARFDKMLSSAEVGNLVTALGCGIGRDEFAIEKLRYHRVIIMTDADVDGSHIRTLLLTFFFRQMPELIERGHIFIAQPPLYKVRKGKQERYVKDDVELNGHFLSTALEEAQLYTSPDATPMASAELETLAKDYRMLLLRLEQASRAYPLSITEALIDMPAVTLEMLHDEAQMKVWSERLQTRLAAENVSVDLRLDPERQVYCPRVELRIRGITEQITLSHAFFSGTEYRGIARMSERLASLLNPGAYIRRGDKSTPVSRFGEVVDWLLTEARRGVDIQRYKGLGEMNPDQLWKTTMDPEVRRMLRVTVDDAIAADQMFTTLMGDQVEPRREFIETNALSVVNLDV